MSAVELAQRVVDAFNRYDPATFAELYADDAVLHDPAYLEPQTGREAIKNDIIDFIRAFPDSQDTITTALGDGDTAALEVTIHGTHQGSLPLPDGDLTATGRPLRLSIAAFIRTGQDGRIIEEHRYYDVAGLREQLTTA